MANSSPTPSNSSSTPPTTPDSITGNAIFLLLIAVLASTVLIPLIAGKLPTETLSNIAISSMGVIGTLAAGAAGWHFRGKFTTPSNQPPANGSVPKTEDLAPAGTQTVILPSPLAAVATASPARVKQPEEKPTKPDATQVPSEANPTGKPA